MKKFKIEKKLINYILSQKNDYIKLIFNKILINIKLKIPNYFFINFTLFILV